MLACDNVLDFDRTEALEAVDSMNLALTANDRRLYWCLPLHSSRYYNFQHAISPQIAFWSPQETREKL